MALPTGKLVHQWKSGDTDYRIVALGKWSAGYEDVYLLEKAETDSLGGLRWVQVHDWAEEHGEKHWRDVIKPLMEALKQAQFAANERKVAP